MTRHADDRRPVPFPRKPKLDLKSLRAATVLADAVDRVSEPRLTDDLPTLDLWSFAAVGGCPRVLGVDDWGQVLSVEYYAIAVDGSWVRRPDGSYVRLLRRARLPISGGAQ